MTKAEQQLCQLAERTVAHILEEGRKQGHQPDDFMQDADYHIDRGMRHVSTHRLMRNGHQAEDIDGSRGQCQMGDSSRATYDEFLDACSGGQWQKDAAH